MRGLRRRIEAIIEEVNHEIRVDLGLEESTPEELETIKQAIALIDDEPTETQSVEDDESDESKAFGAVLEEILSRL